VLRDAGEELEVGGQLVVGDAHELDGGSGGAQDRLRPLAHRRGAPLADVEQLAALEPFAGEADRARDVADVGAGPEEVGGTDGMRVRPARTRRKIGSSRRSGSRGP
jgi:hypothetical protein